MSFAVVSNYTTEFGYQSGNKAIFQENLSQGNIETLKKTIQVGGKKPSTAV